MMNPVELACARGAKNILLYFIQEMNLKSKDEFNINHRDLPLEE